MFNIPEELNKKDYVFLTSDKHLGNNIMLLAYGGSIAYGTNLPTSDIDIRGIALNSRDEVFGVDKDFEQVVEINTDTTIYSLKKMVQLLMSCNPNTIEILGCKPEHYLYVTNTAEMLLNIKEAFLSKIAIKSFGGYARDQFNRLEHGLLGNGENDSKYMDMLKHSLERSIDSFYALHSNTELNLNVNIKTKEEAPDLWDRYKHSEKCEQLEKDIYVTGTIKDCPITELKSAMGGIVNVYNDFGRLNKRNTKKDGMHLAKHMMHLLRLYFMGTELNTKGTIHTYREDEHDLLMDVRNGKYMYDNEKKVKPEFYDILHDVQNKYEESIKDTVLPDKPNIDRINYTLYEIYRSNM